VAGEGAGAEPYFAPILFSLRVLDAPGLATFAVDARHRLYVDFDAVAAWSALENAEALLHDPDLVTIRTARLNSRAISTLTGASRKPNCKRGLIGDVRGVVADMIISFRRGTPNRTSVALSTATA
jgi:hypothetical protein